MYKIVIDQILSIEIMNNEEISINLSFVKKIKPIYAYLLNNSILYVYNIRNILYHI